MKVPGEWIGLASERRYWLASCVVGMGWLSAVGVTQQAHRQMVLADEVVPGALLGTSVHIA